MTTTTSTKSIWEQYADKALNGELLTIEEGVSILQADDDEVLPIMQAAFRVRKHYYGKKVKLNMIFNAKSGLCPEDCGYCSQSIVSSAPVEKYSLLDKETLIAGAKEAMNRKAGTYCIVASGRGPTEKEVDQVIDAVSEITATMPLKICACLGILSDEKAKKLKEAGVHRYNHNLNTHKDNHANITSTHSYDDRVNTVEEVKAAGMSPCSGCIIGMGETDEQIVEIAYSLREIDADSIPVNFLHAIPGTPLENYKRTKPMKSLKVLALMRFINPPKEIRVSGGREVNLRTLQPLALFAANSIFVGDYLTTKGQAVTEDHNIIEDLGFEIEECAL
ncbi:biotin synthase BioB [Alkalihalobacterium chitinilyticum]|uniref:Biotin synthase n=1 Tax=Alkalihalobacterium chitinilyticum TaxID=2980103 RepID=A0ABT5VD85_9BACI|nr:biotin synthase BioB [Alkalihalobacterium chitinilyticum]MDE5412169.1 biotin synthase BioB [Alkalihalobacterium chitinilyticum]